MKYKESEKWMSLSISISKFLNENNETKKNLFESYNSAIEKMTK
jgi:hypothetical protein